MKYNFYRLTPAVIVRLLFSSGFASFKSDYPLQEMIKSIIPDFLKLLLLPEDERKKWVVDLEQGKDEPDDGLIEKNGGIYDHKFYFHFKSEQRLLPHLYKQNVDIANVWSPFLRNLHLLHTCLSSEMYRILKAIDMMYPKFQLLKKVNSYPQDKKATLRLLYYKPGNKVMAKNHYDQSVFTFHVANSHHGLLVGKENIKSSTIYKAYDDMLLLFPGIKAEIVTDSSLPAQIHGAVADHQTIQEGRWSIVFFYHCDVGIASAELSKMIKEKMLSVM